MTRRGRKRISISVAMDLRPHPLDAEILKLAGEIRRLIDQRAGYFKGLANRRPVSQETRLKISQALRGREVSAASRAKMAAAQRGKKQSPAHRAAASRARLATRRRA